MKKGLLVLCLSGLPLLLLYHTSSAQAPLKRAKSTNYAILKIALVGNHFFSKPKIQDQTSFARPRWWQFPASFFALFSKPRLNAKLVATDEFAIDSLYHTHGFWDAKSEISWEMKGKNKVEVVITLIEGERTYLSELTVSGGFSEFEAKVSAAVSRLRLNQPFDKTKLDLVIFELKKVYANRGFPYAEVQTKIEQTEDKKSAKVNLEIEAGEKVHFGQTEIGGLEITKEEVVRREFAFQERDMYSREKLIETKQRIYATGLFSFVNLDAKDPQHKPVTPDFQLRVVERKPRFIRVGFLAGQKQQQDLTADFSGEFGNRNLFGSGRRFSLSATTSIVLLSRFQYLSSRFTLNYFQPWLLGLRVPLDLEAYYEPGAKSVIQPYRIEQFGGNINLRQQLRKQTRLWLSGSYQQVNIYGISESEEEVFRRDKGINIRRKMGFSLENDTRSNLFVPLGGSHTNLQAEFFGGILGGDHNFAKVVLSWSRYFPAAGGTQLETWAFRLKLGRAFEYKLKDFVPSFDRFYLGGASSIRGYVENSLGPKDSAGKVVGGKIIGLTSLEYRKALFGKLGWSMFLDWGNAWLETENVTWRSLRLSGGLGLQYFSPLGPIRLDYGRKLLRGSEGLKGGRLHLSILYAF